MDGIRFRGLTCRAEGVELTQLAMYMCAPSMSYRMYYRQALVLFDIDVEKFDSLPHVATVLQHQQHVISQEQQHPTDADEQLVPNAVMWAAKIFSDMSAETPSCLHGQHPMCWGSPFTTLTDQICTSFHDETRQQASVSHSSCHTKEGHDETYIVGDLFMAMDVHKYLVPGVALCSRFFSDLYICRGLHNDSRQSIERRNSSQSDSNHKEAGTDPYFQDYVIISAAFLSTCGYGRDEMKLSSDEVLSQLCYTLRLTIVQSLLAVRSDLCPVAELWQACRLSRGTHCGSCILNEWNWPVCCNSVRREAAAVTNVGDYLGAATNTTCCCVLLGDESGAGTGAGSSMSTRCKTCQQLRHTYFSTREGAVDLVLPTDIFVRLGREDFVRNYGGNTTGTAGGYGGGMGANHPLYMSPDDASSWNTTAAPLVPTKRTNFDAIIAAFPHLARDGDGIFVCEESEIGGSGLMLDAASTGAGGDMGVVTATGGGGR